ncbi:MAG: D-glycero-beta-D-manno-heptose-7-phosphate kinase [Paenibacillaceae bacterium]|nr:D-glycero-beta-D-manno-heptose-7-phosphate kinase [Paenibacillaceae bacterium]
MDYTRLKKFSEIKVLVLGDFMLDKYITGEVKRISPEAPVPVIEVKEKETYLGGAGNVINNIIALGGHARIITCIGDDQAGDYLLDHMVCKGVDTKYVWKVEGERTIIKTRIVAKSQQFLRYDEEDIREISEDYVNYVKLNVEEIFKDINIVIISDYGKGNVSYKLAQAIIKKARLKNIPIIVDPKGKDYSKYTGATVCTPNMSEFNAVVSASELMNEEQIAIKGKKLCEDIDLKYVLVTRSEKGMSLIEGSCGIKQDLPAIAKEVVDVTGAGDTVISVFSLAMAVGYSLSDCCKLSNKAASIVISHFGAATTTIKEIEQTGFHGTGSKILQWEQVRQVVQNLRKEGKKIVFTNGCFDLVHAGHIASFEQARALGDVLIVGLNSDTSVKMIKGDKRPIVTQENRVKLLSALTVIDYIIIFEQDTPKELIDLIIPDVLVKGKDWSGKEVVGQDVVEANGGVVELIDLEQGLSTTNVIEKIRELYH